MKTLKGYEIKTVYKTKNLTVRYLIALSLIALLSISASVLIRTAIYKQTSDAPVINFSGRQRMLSQKLTKEILLLTLAPSLEMKEHYRGELEETAANLSRVHNGLQHGDEALGLPGNNSREVQNFFAKMEPHYQKMKEAVNKILTLNSKDLSQLPSDSLLVKGIIEASPLYLIWMDRTVFQYDKEAKTRLELLKGYETFIISFVLLLLVLEALLIFRPMVEKVKRTYENFQRTNDQLLKEIINHKHATEDLEKQSLFAQRLSALAAMSGGIAHELHQPLSGIGLYSTTLQNIITEKKSIDSDYLLETLKKINNQVDRASKVIDHMREFSSGGGNEETVTLNLNGAIKKSLELFNVQLQKHGIELKMDVPLELHIQADVNRFEQVIINLVSNAKDSLIEKSSKLKKEDWDKCIHIQCRKKKNKILIDLSDKGLGVPKELRKTLFEPFVTCKAKTKASGLGLSICRRILLDFDADIELLKTGTKGSTFRISFPLATEKISH